MKQPNDTTANRSMFLPVGLVILGAILFLAARYLMDSWAEASALYHTTQHGVIFLAGISVGVGTYRIFSDH